MKRRMFLMGVAVTSLTMSAIGGARSVQAAATQGKSLDEIERNWKSLIAPEANLTLSTEPIQKTEAEWKQLLDKMQFRVLRGEGTERPHSSALNFEKRRGIYACAGCRLPLFSSEMKYDSGTGWPSFFTHIPGHLDTKQDFALIIPRTEYHCIRCGGHQGHVFKDGPPPTGKRWCNNGIALRFVPV